VAAQAAQIEAENNALAIKQVGKAIKDYADCLRQGSSACASGVEVATVKLSADQHKALRQGVQDSLAAKIDGFANLPADIQNIYLSVANDPVQAAAMLAQIIKGLPAAMYEDYKAKLSAIGTAIYTGGVPEFTAAGAALTDMLIDVGLIFATGGAAKVGGKISAEVLGKAGEFLGAVKKAGTTGKAPNTALPSGYARNVDGSYTGPGGGKSWNTGEVDASGNPIMRRDGGGYFAVDQNGTQISARSPYESTTPVHHVCTNKNCVSTANGGPWTPRFQEIFDNAGLNINSEINKIAVPGHQGPHPTAYHQYVFDRLQTATAGLQPNSSAYTSAVQNSLNTIKAQAITSGHQVNSWLTGN